MLCEMQVLKGHQIKILKWIKEFKQSNEPIVKKVSQLTNYDNFKGIKTVNNNSGTDLNSSDDLKQLEIYEQEQRKLFEQAVMDYRNSNSNERPVFISNNEPEIQEEISYPIENAKNVLYSVGSGMFDFNSVLFNTELVTTNELNKVNKSIDSDFNQVLPVNKLKSSCWICYKIILAETAFTNSFNKQFCSLICYHAFNRNFLVN